MAEVTYKICSKCGRRLNEMQQYYSRKDGTKVDMCKKCLTMHVDPFDNNTFEWILKELNVPYIPQTWQSVCAAEIDKNPKVTPMAILGRYLAKMRIKQFLPYDYEHSKEAIEALIGTEVNKEERAEDRQKRVEELKGQLERGEITDAQYQTLVPPETRYNDETEKHLQQLYEEAAAVRDLGDLGSDGSDQGGSSPAFNEDDYMSEEDIPNPAQSLTQEDKIYLAMKWGRFYKPNEWIELERKYLEMKESFDIQDSDTEGTLIVICKTYLKMNQAIDEGDTDAFNKLSRTYDTLRKSAKFTAAQNKNQDSDFISSIGELVAYCEKEGGKIPKFDVSEPLDKIDSIIADLKEYNKSLIYSDTALAAQIEEYLRKREIMDQTKLEKLLNKGKERAITDQDVADFYEEMRNLGDMDRVALEEESDNEESEELDVEEDLEDDFE